MYYSKSGRDLVTEIEKGRVQYITEMHGCFKRPGWEVKFIQNLRVLMEWQIIRHMGRVTEQVIKYVYTQRISTILYQ